MAKKESANWFKQTSGNFMMDAKSGAINSAIGRGKIVELLHKQLVRKNRVYKKDFINLGNIKPFGKVYTILGYDIKTPSTRPYNYNNKSDLGLNQFFMGQNPYKNYRGDPKDGIYHDTVKIVFRFNGMPYPAPFLLNTDTKDTWQYQNQKFHSKYYSVVVGDGYRNDEDYSRANYWMEYRKDEIEKDWGKILKEINNWFITEKGYLIEVVLPYHQQADDDENIEGGYVVMPLFYKDNDMPVIGSKQWLDSWNSVYKLHIDEDKGIPGWLMPLAIMAMVVITYFTWGATAGAWGAIASGAATLAQIGAVGTFLTAAGLTISLIGISTGNKTISLIGQVVGYIGAIGSIYVGVKELFFQSAAKAGASTLTNSSVASMQGMAQTSSLYSNISMSSISTGTTSIGAAGASNTNSVMFATSENAFSSALHGYNTGVGTLNTLSAVNTSQLYLTQTLKGFGLGKRAYEATRNIIGAFRKPNKFDDEDMNEQSNDEKAISVSSSNFEIEGMSRKFYDRDIEYDLGLEHGTLMSNDDSLLYT